MKTEYKKLDNPPIVEAVLSVSIDNALFTLEEINKFYDKILAKEYEEKKEIKNRSLTFSFDENEVKHENNVVPVGLSALNKKKNQVFNFEIQKLSISKLAPYESGEKLINDFIKVSAAAIKHSGKKPSIKSIGVRYINKFVLPAEKVDHYFKIIPSLKYEDKSISFMDRFYMFSIYSSKYTARSTIHAGVRDLKDNQVEILLDIDVINEERNIQWNDDALIVIFNRLKEFKNEIFFSNIENAEELFKCQL